MMTSDRTKLQTTTPPSALGGFRRAFGCTYEALALFRISLGCLLVLELVTRFRFLHPFYSDEGTLPLRLLLPKIDDLYKAVCLHVHLHELWQVQLVLAIQVVAAILFTVGYKTKVMTIISWYLYLSLTLRNTWLNFILDRYFHYLLFYAMFLPLDKCCSVSSMLSKEEKPNHLVLSAATIALKCLVFWIYLDAGGGKYLDPLEGWTYNAKPLPALDTYTRHTVFARYMYGMLGPQGLRLMTPTVVYVELLVAPLALLGGYLASPAMVNTAVTLIWQLHVGIALCMNNAVLLSFVACTVWCIFLPVGWDKISTTTTATTPPPPPTTTTTTTTSDTSQSKFSIGSIMTTIIVLGMISGNLWFETISESCDQTIFYSTIFHCRWNVFVGAEEYVTWEIAPGLLADGSVVDVWGRKEEVDWRLPGAGAPCTSTSRPGRWRSFPYLAGLEGEDGEALWSYLCRQWDKENDAESNPGRKLIKFNFFMLQADVLPNMGFSATRKRLIHSYECVKTSELDSELDAQHEALTAESSPPEEESSEAGATTTDMSAPENDKGVPYPGITGESREEGNSDSVQSETLRLEEGSSTGQAAPTLDEGGPRLDAVVENIEESNHDAAKTESPENRESNDHPPQGETIDQRDEL